MSARISEWFKRLLAAAGAALLLAGGLFASGQGFQEVLDFRLLERIPPTTILGSVGGESHLQGRPRGHLEMVKAPRTGTESFYYRYLEEEERRDSDGDTYWATVDDHSRAVDFFLDDHTGSVFIRARESTWQIRWPVKQKHSSQSGKRRYTEWRIDPGDKVTVFGWLDLEASTPTLNFHAPGNYLPIVSSFSASEVRSDIGATAIIWLWAGVTCFIFMSFGIFYFFKWHKTLAYLVIVSLSVTSLLAYYGRESLESDILNGAKRVAEQHSRTDKTIREIFTRVGIEQGDAGLAAAYKGLEEPFDLTSPLYYGLSGADIEKINAMRNVAYEVRARYMRQIEKFPESFFARLRGLDQPAEINLPADQLAIADNRVRNFTTTQSPDRWFMTPLVLILVALTVWFAFRQIKVKRMQENLPTSKTAGVVYGLTEVKGKLKVDPAKEPFTGPVSGEPCTWYRYIIKERRGSGKNAKWVTVKDDTRKQPFFIEDEEGEVRVFPVKAEIITRHRSSKREGNRQYIETRMQPGDDLYILGKAKQDKTRGDKLVIAHEKGSPYIVANYSEEEVMFFKASKAMLSLSIGVSLLFLASLWVSGSNGNFSSLDFVLLACIGPLFLTIEMFVLMYNDLVFLRQRCERNWSNIQVSLKKRATLVPRLEAIVKEYLSHEQSVLEKIASLRDKRNAAQDTASLDEYMALEHSAIEDLNIRVEEYPDLKANVMTADLMRRLIKLENEVALIRAGYNDSVMLFNTRVQTFPDNLLAGVFRFAEKSSLRFTDDAHRIVPAVTT